MTVQYGTYFVQYGTLLMCQFHDPCFHPSSVHPLTPPLAGFQTVMTSSKSDLEAKEGQLPNESNFLEFVSLLGSLSREGGASAQEEERTQQRGDTHTADQGGRPHGGGSSSF